MLVAIVIATIPAANAQTNATTQPNFFQGLIQSIAQKFGLQQSQVQSVVNDYHQQQKQKMQQNMQDRQKQRLDQLVKDGKITSTQETLIINELASLRNKYNPENMKDKTPDQRKTQMDSMQNEFKAWAQSQGIDPSIIMPGFGMGPRGRMKVRWGDRKNNISVTPSPTQ